MKLHLYRYSCKQCGNQFKSPELATSYGEFLLRNATGEMKYVNAISDPVYKEVSQILKAIPANQGKSDIEIAETLDTVFGVSCDTAQGEREFVLNAPPCCPKCGSQDMSYWEATDPPEYSEQLLDTVTHNKWNCLSSTDKEKLVVQALNTSRNG